MHDPFGADQDEVSPSINVTPFVDVVLVLLVIFMVTTDLIKPAAIEVQLPRAGQAGELLPRTLNLVVTQQGEILLDGAALDRELLARRLHEATSGEQRPQVVIAADRSVDYGRVIELIDIVKSHGINDFALQIDRG